MHKFKNFVPFNVHMEGIEDFLEKLASPSPAPGGGAASAFVSIVGGSLISMVSQLTIGKKNYAQYDAEMKGILERERQIEKDLRSLIDEDERAFNAIMEALKMPKDTESQKKVREEKLQSALRTGIDVPWKIARKAYDLLALVEPLADHGNKNAVTDAGSAALFLQAAIKAALYNVKINLKMVKDEDYVADQRMKINVFLENTDDLFERIRKKVEEKL
ncbi:formiminotransferase cyclodeaminase related protein [Thermoplasma acidophilum]|uniref:Formiminotransferase cyclodeaminase related protein n=2 Tax=Thermoplasma acidophilum TaxID=2303 RepID=Q9HI68_THEAC|nr:formiminotransferase cyclodeaminase related protein [Thermoplasma acidophilum]